MPEWTRTNLRPIDIFRVNLQNKRSVISVALVFTSFATWANDAGSHAALKQVAKLTASDGTAGDNFGYSVGISGNTIVVGAYGATIGSNQAQGAAYVFVKPASGWGIATQTAKLTASDGEGGDYFGSSVSVSGNFIIVGAPLSQSHTGSAYLFIKPVSGWTNMTETAKLTPADAAPNAYYGTSVSINSNTAVVGANGVAGNQGALYVFVEPKSGWTSATQTAKLTTSDAGLDTLGNSVYITGKMVVAGAETASALYVFVEPSLGWANMSQTAKLTASDGSSEDLLGASVAVNGNTIVGGAPNKNAAYVFIEPTEGWVNMTQTAELTDSSEPPNHLLGFSVALSGSMVVTGLPGSGDSISPGIADGFVEPKTGWVSTSVAKLRLSASDGTALDDFGGAVSMTSTASRTVVIGAAGATHGSAEGAAYIFQ